MLALVAPGSSLRLRAFMLTLVIADDLAALTVIVLFYSERVQLVPVAVALAGFALVVAR